MRRIVIVAGSIGIVAAIAIVPLTATGAGAHERSAFSGGAALRDADHNRIDDALDARLPRMASSARIGAIALFRAPVSAASLRRSIGSFGLRASWNAISGVSGTFSPGQLRALARRSDLVHLEGDRRFTASMSTARRWYGVDQAVGDFAVTGDRSGALKTYSKTDVVACIVDTGIDAAHVDLNQGQVVGWKDLVNGRSTPYDDNGHGTHVAGILAGQGDGTWAYRGVAYGTALVGVKALDSQGTGSTTTILSGVNFCVANKAAYNIKIINMSLGSSASSDGTDALSRAVNSAADAGIVPVVAAGNGGPSASTIGSPGAAANAITVCSIADAGERGFFESTFSSRGPTADGRIKPDVCAPGENITSVRAGSGNGYTTLSGTSMATPFVSGVVALMLDANPNMTPGTVKSFLMSTAQDWRSSGADTETGAGRLQAYDAIKAAGGYAGTGPAVPSHFSSWTQSLGGTGKSDIWTIAVTKTSYAIALTLNVPGATSAKDFDLYLEYWTGSAWSQKGASETSTRQETIAYTPTAAGTYRITVRSYAGSGSYYLDSSYGGASPQLTTNG